MNARKVGYFIAIIFIVSLTTLVQPAKADVDDNVSGWAWSETVGWISFNCTDREVCPTSDYGVNIDSATGNFSGYGWSENIGWINFAPAGPYPLAPDYSAKFDSGTSKVTGWARAEAYGNGWDGWILLGKEAGGWANQVTIDSETGEFHGWAWGDDKVGWISFNCADRPGNLCQSKSNYKVTAIIAEINLPPTATCDDNETWNYCVDSRNPKLEWTYSDPDNVPVGTDPQSAYQIQIDTDSGFTAPITIDYTADPSSSNAYQPSGTILQWSTTYYWRIKVRDSNNNWSNWCSPTCSFTTPKHSYPEPDFTWTPQNPSANEPVQFYDQTSFHNGGNSWYWTFESAVPPTSVLQNPVATFSAQGGWDVTLQATDSDAYSCSTFDTINVGLPLPEWKEVIPRQKYLNNKSRASNNKF